MEIVTEPLQARQLEAELAHVIEWLIHHGIDELCVTFGVGSAILDERLWTPIPVNTQGLNAFIGDAIEAGSFTFGKTDLHIYDAATFVKISDRTFRSDYPGLTFTFCHESDMHFRCEDLALVEDVKREWIARGYRGYESADTTQSRNWVAFQR